MIVYRASELGSCTRRLALGRIGYEAKAPTQKWLDIFARGDVTEEEVKTHLRAEKWWYITREQEEVTLQITDEIAVVGHIDGVGVDGTSQPIARLLEIKRMNDAYWKVVRDGGWYVDGLMEKYRWQISAYMLALDMEAVLVCRNGDTGEDHYLYAETPFYTKNDIAARVLVVEGRARSFTTLDALGECDRLDYPCPFYYTHLENEREDAGEDAEAIEALGIAYRQAREREQRSKDEATRCRDDIGRLLGNRERVAAGRIKVTRYTSKRSKLDKARAKRDGIDLSEYESTTESTAIRITVVEEENADKDEAGT